MIKIGAKTIGKGHPAFIVAEMSANHGKDLSCALAIIEAAKEAGADAVKLQTYTADALTLNSDNTDFLIPDSSPWASFKTLHALYEYAAMPTDWHAALYSKAKEVGIEIFSAPFDVMSVDLLEDLNTPLYKIASPEINDVPLLEAVARTGKPVVISTGIASLEDISFAMTVLRNSNSGDVIILKCTTEYPAPIEDANLLSLKELASTFDCLVGVSDHTIGHTVPVVSTALGGVMIEKHFKLDDAKDTADSFFSLDQKQFRTMVESVREAEKSLGTGTYDIADSAKKNVRGGRSLYIKKNIKCGEVLNAENIACVRPGLGLHPKYYYQVLGKKALVDLAAGDRVDWNVLE